MSADDDIPLGLLAVQLYRMMWNLGAEVLRPFRITMNQFECLSLMAENPGLSNVELAEHMGVTPQTASAVQRSLEQAGLIERTRKSTDGRVMTTQLTKRGRSLQRECDVLMRIEDARVMEALKAPKRTQLKRLLGIVIRAHTQQVGHPGADTGASPARALPERRRRRYEG